MSGHEIMASHDTRCVADQPHAICGRCWVDFFSTPQFRQFGRTTRAAHVMQHTVDKNYVVRYTVDKNYALDAAANGCGWCAFVIELDEHDNDNTNGEASQDNTTVYDTSLSPWTSNSGGNNHFHVTINGVSKSLTAFTEEDDVASDIVPARPVQNNVTSDAAFQEIIEWLNTCPGHQSCRSAIELQLPNRVIDVGPCRLLNTRNMPGKYVALSYCWGSKQRGITTTANVGQRVTQGIHVNELSQTVKEAIMVTQRLGLQYLWVDAVCIIQDSEEDKDVQLQRMFEIYQNAYLTIAAASSSDSDAGFLRMREAPRPSVNIPFWSRSESLGSVNVHLEEFYDEDSEPLNKRGWALQEKLLSPRLVVYASHTIQFQCQTQTVNLGRSLHNPTYVEPNLLPTPILYDFDPNTYPLTTNEAVNAWMAVVMMYSPRELSFAGDKLVALSSLAQAFQPHIGTAYLAGIWAGREVLPFLLLWEVIPNHNGSKYPTYIAPSWSWASLAVPVFFGQKDRLTNVVSCIDILSSTTALINDGMPYGGVRGGSMRVRAHRCTGKFIPPHKIVLKRSGDLHPKEALDNLKGTHFPAKTGLRFATAKLDIFSDFEVDNITCLAVVTYTLWSFDHGFCVYDGILVQPRSVKQGLPVYHRLGSFKKVCLDEFGEVEKETLILE